MTEEEFQDKMEKIYAYNRKKQEDARELLSLRSHEEEIRKILQALRNPLKLDLLQAIEKIRKVVNL